LALANSKHSRTFNEASSPYKTSPTHLFAKASQLSTMASVKVISLVTS
jgi:hypothetical protein